jgi:hypothetical protein
LYPLAPYTRARREILYRDYRRKGKEREKERGIKLTILYIWKITTYYDRKRNIDLPYRSKS